MMSVIKMVATRPAHLIRKWSDSRVCAHNLGLLTSFVPLTLGQFGEAHGPLLKVTVVQTIRN